MNDLIAKLEVSDGPDRELDKALGRAFDAPTRYQLPGSEEPSYRPYTSSIDAALTLLPSTACNRFLFDFCGHGIDRPEFPENAWGFTFSDTTQTVGEEAAKERVARLTKDWGTGNKLAGPPKRIFEKAIAEHFLVFDGSHTPNGALAICIAAVKARIPKP